MSYVDPTSVSSPVSRWRLGDVLFSSGRGGWSVCEGWWDGAPVVGIRWNGSDDETGPGTPQSRGYPTWFVLPMEVAEQVRTTARQLEAQQQGVVCVVDRPAGYDPGAWKLTVTLSDALRAEFSGLQFPLPRVANGMCRGDAGFVCAIPKDGKTELWGRFVDGQWQGHLYVYGFDPDAGVAEVVRDQLVESVRSLLSP